MRHSRQMQNQGSCEPHSRGILEGKLSPSFCHLNFWQAAQPQHKKTRPPRTLAQSMREREEDRVTSPKERGHALPRETSHQRERERGREGERERERDLRETFQAKQLFLRLEYGWGGSNFISCNLILSRGWELSKETLQSKSQSRMILEQSV